MGDKPELYLKKLTKEEKEQIKEEDKKSGIPKILIVLIVLMVAIMGVMFAVSYFWSMKKIDAIVAVPIMVVCLAGEIIICEYANKMNHKLTK